MKRTTIELSGAAKDCLLRNFFRDEVGAGEALADRLARESSALFVGVRVRKGQLGLRRRARAAPKEVPPAHEAFDPFAFGLVPVFQREGREGLLARLSAIAEPGNLQLLARSQQIVLPVHLRSGPAAQVELCSAIADAVERRVAQRRAAAG